MAFTDRSLPAREAILHAARARFGAEGYDRATVRAIAADAGIDPSMVMRYFGSKRQLFAVAAEFDLRLPDLAGTPREEVGHVLATHLLARWEEDDDGLKILLRTAVTDDEAASRMRTIFVEQLTPVIAALADDPAAASTRAGLVSSQALGVALTRYVLRLPPIVTMTPAELVEWIAPTLQRYLVGSR